MYEIVYATPPEQSLTALDIWPKNAHMNHNLKKATTLIESKVIEETTI